MYKVFNANKCIYLSDNAEDFPVDKPGMLLKGHSKKILSRVYKNFIEVAPAEDSLFLLHDNLPQLWRNFSSLFNPIVAAGGVVKNKEGKYLLIYRLNTWDLPKGKVEKGEPIRKAAIREVHEECGLSNLKICGNLNPTYHTYVLKGKPILKTTHWFEMAYTGSSAQLTPQLEENITKASWMNVRGLNGAKKNMYPLIADLLNAVIV